MVHSRIVQICCCFCNSTRLRAFIDPAEAAIVHLIGAVEDDDVLAETAAHVLGGLRLTSARWAGRCATERHANSLRQRDVTSAWTSTPPNTLRQE